MPLRETAVALGYRICEANCTHKCERDVGTARRSISRMARISYNQ